MAIAEDYFGESSNMFNCFARETTTQYTYIGKSGVYEPHLEQDPNSWNKDMLFHKCRFRKNYHCGYFFQLVMNVTIKLSDFSDHWSKKGLGLFFG